MHTYIHIPSKFPYGLARRGFGRFHVIRTDFCLLAAGCYFLAAEVGFVLLGCEVVFVLLGCEAVLVFAWLMKVCRL